MSIKISLKLLHDKGYVCTRNTYVLTWIILFQIIGRTIFFTEVQHIVVGPRARQLNVS